MDVKRDALYQDMEVRPTRLDNVDPVGNERVGMAVFPQPALHIISCRLRLEGLDDVRAQEGGCRMWNGDAFDRR